MKDISGSDSLAQDWFMARLKKYEGKGKIFDFGGGSEAGFGHTLAKMGFDVYVNDIQAPKFQNTLSNLHYIQGDITDIPLEIFQARGPFDFITNLSSIEHAGLVGRYDSKDDINQDLKVMKILQKIIKSDGIHFIQFPIGLDTTIGHYHRVYGKKRLPLLLEGWHFMEQCFWGKEEDNEYRIICENMALQEEATEGEPHYYAVACYALRLAPC